MLLILLGVFALNLVITFFNGRNVGRAWVESKYAGGWRRFMAWSGAVMTALGYTWCIMVVLGLIAGAAHWLDPYHIEVYFATSYVILIPPLLFFGYAITLNSWANAYREHTISSTAIAGYNTFASAYNTYNAVNTFGDAFGKMMDGLFKNSGKNKDSVQGMIIVLLVILAVGGGTLLAYWEINHFAAQDEPMPLRAGGSHHRR